MLKNIGSIGLGAMGGSYAKHLLEKKFKVFGIDPDKENSKKFMSYGGIICNDINELIQKTDVIILSLPTVPIFKEIISEITNTNSFYKDKSKLFTPQTKIPAFHKKSPLFINLLAKVS